MEQEKKKMKKETKKLLIASCSFIAIILLIGIVFGVIFPQLNKKEIQTSSQPENKNIQQEEKDTVEEESKNLEDKTNTKEQIINFLTSTDTKTQSLYICQFGELRLRNELKYLKENVSYVYLYDYKVIGDNTINFYMLISEPYSSYGIDFYNIWAYQASYTITDETCKYLNNFISGSNTSNVTTVKELFKINKEIKLSLYNGVQQSNYSHFLSEGQRNAARILNFDPYNNSNNNQTSDNSTSETGNNNSSTISNNNNSSSSNSSNKKVKYTHKAISGCELVDVDSSANWVKYVPKCVHCGTKEKLYSGSNEVLVCKTTPREYVEGTYEDSFYCVECGKNYDIIIKITETYE